MKYVTAAFFALCVAGSVIADDHSGNLVFEPRQDSAPMTLTSVHLNKGGGVITAVGDMGEYGRVYTTYTLTADLPGLTKGDVHLTVEDGVLTLSGERKGERSESNEFGHRYERAYGKFSRSFQLESGIENSKISAEFKNGLLKVVLPKVEASKPFEVSIAE